MSNFIQVLRNASLVNTRELAVSGVRAALVGRKDGEIAVGTYIKTPASESKPQVLESVLAIKHHDGITVFDNEAMIAEIVAKINALDKAQTVVDGINVHVTYSEVDGIVTISGLSEDYAVITRTATSSTATVPATNAAIAVTTGDEAKLVKASDLANVAAYAADKVTEEQHRVDKKIADLSGTQTGTVDYTSVKVDTAAGNVSGVTVTQKVQSVSEAVSGNTEKMGLAEASDVKAYVDSKAAASTTVVTQKAGITVTEVRHNGTNEDGHVEYQVASNLILAYNAASEGNAATITLKSAVRADETQVTYGTVNVSDIIGNGVLDSSSYDKTTGILTLNFKNASGGTTPIQINLTEMLDIDDVIIGQNSQNYLKVSLDGGEGQDMVLDTKIVNVANARAAQGETPAVTGLTDALDVKTYVDSKAADLAVTAEGDDYVSATVDADVDNKHVVVDADVQNVTASAGTRGTWTVSDAGVATLAGETAPSISGVEKSLMDGKQAMESVKTYVDAKVVVEAAERAAKIEAAVKSLDVTDAIAANQFVSGVSETDGKIAVSRGTLASSNNTVIVTAGVDTEGKANGNIDLAVRVDGKNIILNTAKGHVGELMVGTIDCGEY